MSLVSLHGLLVLVSVLTDETSRLLGRELEVEVQKASSTGSQVIRIPVVANRGTFSDTHVDSIFAVFRVSVTLFVPCRDVR